MSNIVRYLITVALVCQITKMTLMEHQWPLSQKENARPFNIGETGATATATSRWTLITSIYRFTTFSDSCRLSPRNWR